MNATLAEIVVHKRSEVAEQKQSISSQSLSANLQVGSSGFKRALLTLGTHFITEIKPKSPSTGILRRNLKLDLVIKSYNDHASAISVLTDEKFFGGSFDLLAQVKGKSQLPILCKDFIIDAYQCLQARSAGADAVLLIVKILEDNLLANLYSEVVRLGMTPIVEVQNEAELGRAKTLAAEIIMINNRNLDTFEIDLSTTLRLAPMLPPQTVVIAASGIESRADIVSLSPVCSNFLIGTALMSATNITDKLKKLKGMTPTPESVAPSKSKGIGV